MKAAGLVAVVITGAAGVAMTTSTMASDYRNIFASVGHVKSKRKRKEVILMANRCPDCNKFVGIEFNEPEDIDIQITRVGELEEGGIQHLEAEGEVRLVLTCADCGAELAESEQTYECEVEFQHVNDPHCTGDVEVTIEAMNDDFFDPPGRPPRYQKHYYQANLTTTFKCPTCESEAEVEGLVNEAAGGFNEC